MQRIMNKTLASFLVLTLMFSYFSIIGIYGPEVFATEGQTAGTNNANVEFDSRFSNGGYTKEADINSAEEKLVFTATVKNTGYIKDAEITLSGANFEITQDSGIEGVEQLNKAENKIKLAIVKAGTTMKVEIPIQAIKKNQVQSDLLGKDTTVKFVATYVNENGKEKRVEKELINHLTWTGNASIVANQTLTKYIPFETPNEKGLIMQTSITSGLDANMLPIAKTEIIANVSKIAGQNPSKVIVEAKRTMATNGEGETAELNPVNAEYDRENGTVKIQTENTVQENGTVSWEKEGNDEYIITYIFLGNEVYELTKSVITESFITDINITTLDGQTRNSKIEGSIDLTEGLGQVTDFATKTVETTLSKGYVYANLLNSQTKIETEFTQILSANTSYIGLVDSLELVQKADIYLDQKEQAYDSLDIYNKKILVSENNFLRILGDEGYIEVYNKAGEKLYTIQKVEDQIIGIEVIDETKAKKDEQGNYYIDLAELGTDSLTFKTSKPVQEGKLEIRIQKAIKGETQYNRSQLEVVEKIKTELTGKSKLEVTDVTNTTTNSTIEFTEPVTKAEIAFEKAELSTAVVNENVGMTITLITDSTDDALFKNPTLNIQMPEYVDSFELKDVHLIYGQDELTIKEANYNQKTKILTIKLEGTQTSYSIGAISKGAVVTITADIAINNLTANQTAVIGMHYTNANSKVFEKVDEQGNGYTETTLNIIAPPGLVTVNGMEGYSEQETGVQSISSGEEQVGTLSIHAGIKRAKVIGKIVNNLGNSAKEVSILGRTPFKGNKTIDTGRDLGTNIDTTVLTKVTLEGAEADIYYTANGEATKDLNNANNGWTKEPEDLAQVKSYLIVLKAELPEGSVLNFYYDVEIPADLPYECSAYTTYKVYYNNVYYNEEQTLVGEIPQSSEATPIGLTTQAGPKLEASIKLEGDNPEAVSSEQIAKFYITIKNSGQKTAEGVVAKINLPEYLCEYRFITCNNFEKVNGSQVNLSFGNIEVEQTKSFCVYIGMPNYTEGQEGFSEGDVEKINNETYIRPIEITANITGTNITEPVTATTNVKLQRAYTKVELIGDYEDRQAVSAGQEIHYRLMIRSTAPDTINNVVTKINIPDGLEYKKAYREGKDGNGYYAQLTDNITYDQNKNQISITTPKLESVDEDKVIVDFTIKNGYTGPIKVSATSEASGKTAFSNVSEINAEKVTLEVSELTTSKKYVKEKEEFTYNLTVRNTSNQMTTISVEDALPAELDIVQATYTSTSGVNKIRTMVDGKLTFTMGSVKPGETKQIVITVKSKLLSEAKDKEIQNKVKVSATGADTKETNTVTNIIEYDAAKHQLQGTPGSGITTPTTTGYKISGVAWLDENRDGKKDDAEQKLAGVKVILLNKSDYSVVTDSQNKQKVATTGNDGKYEFSGLAKGEYIVAFIYNSGTYELTTYHKDGVDAGYNSDAIAMNITYEGETHNAAATDILKITDENIREIDIGLVQTEKFDLRLDKYITKISVTSTEGNRTYEYNNGKFTKIELPSKATENSTIVVEYKIVVKNEGAITGYAKKVIDYIPSDMKFSSNLNSDWYLGQDGNVYNTTLENTEIKPGETKELTIVLTKKLNGNNLGTVTNYAEIFEAYNAKGNSDIDSTPGNKVQTEDDFSTASVTITVITGKVVSFIGITLASIAIIALGTFGIKKYVIKKI